MDYGLYFLISFYVNMALIVLVFLSGPAFFWGLKAKIAKFKYRTNLGFLFLKSKGDDFSFPEPVDLRKDKFIKKNKEGESKWIIDEDCFKQGTFLGTRFAMFSYDDCLTSIGLYYQQNQAAKDDESKLVPSPTFYNVYDKNGKPVMIPELKSFKPSNQVPPKLIQNLAINEKLDSFLKQIQQNKTLLYILIGATAAAAIAAYFTYQMYSTQVPELLNILKEIRGLLKGV